MRQARKDLGVSHDVGDVGVFIGLMGGFIHSSPDDAIETGFAEVSSYRPAANADWRGFHAIDFLDRSFQ